MSASAALGVMDIDTIKLLPNKPHSDDRYCAVGKWCQPQSAAVASPADLIRSTTRRAEAERNGVGLNLNDVGDAKNQPICRLGDRHNCMRFSTLDVTTYGAS